MRTFSFKLDMPEQTRSFSSLDVSIYYQIMLVKKLYTLQILGIMLYEACVFIVIGQGNHELIGVRL